MIGFARRLINFFDKYYWLFLVAIAFLAYGQLLLMFPWQDDHTLFFKLAHIQAKAGYFGYGPLGEGAYKYIATPYILIYKLFGQAPVYYFAFALIFYILTTLVVHKVFAKIDNRLGRVAGFLYACGFVASDGYIRVFNSVATSLSIMLVSWFLLNYYLYFKKRRIVYYTFAVSFFWLAIEFARIRTHYLILVALAFELIFFVFDRFPRNLVKSSLRILPFIGIFYYYYIKSADSRSSQIGAFVQSILAGHFDKLYSFLSAITNLFLPDIFLDKLSKFQPLGFLLFGIFIVFVCVFWLMLAQNARKKTILTLLTLTSLGWVYWMKSIFHLPDFNPKDLVVVSFAGEIVLLLMLVLTKLPAKFKPLGVLLVLWMLVNAASYAAYNPALHFVQYHRYLAHSFLPVVGLLALVTLISKKAWVLVMCWGTINLINGVWYQYEIVQTRSMPVKRFYTELKSLMPTLDKGTLLYFDVADSMRAQFADAFSVASMPEETAIAWQYGLDRYDFRRFTSFDELVTAAETGSITDIDKKPLDVKAIHSFYYSKDGLVDTTDVVTKYFASKAVRVTQEEFTQTKTADGYVLAFTTPIGSVTPTQIELSISATPISPTEFTFPVSSAEAGSNFSFADDRLANLAFKYSEDRKALREKTTISASSIWKDNTPSNVLDGRPDTHWRADRVEWSKNGGWLQLDLGQPRNIDRLAWVNGNATNTPSKYQIEVSLDNVSWRSVATVDNQSRIKPEDLQVVNFEQATLARYVRVRFTQTVSSDSPSISEVWVVPMEFSSLDLASTEAYLDKPFEGVSSQKSYLATLNYLNYTGNVQVYWWNDKYADWTTSTLMVLPVNYTGRPANYKLVLPPGGLNISKLKLVGLQIPGKLSVYKLIVFGLPQ